MRQMNLASDFTYIEETFYMCIWQIPSRLLCVKKRPVAKHHLPITKVTSIYMDRTDGAPASAKLASSGD